MIFYQHIGAFTIVRLLGENHHKTDLTMLESRVSNEGIVHLCYYTTLLSKYILD